MLLYTHFYNISLNVLRSYFLNICYFHFAHFPNIRKIRVKVRPNTNYFSYFISSCTNKIVVFNYFFHWYLGNQETNKTIATIFFFSYIFLMIYILLTVLIPNTLSKLVELLQYWKNVDTVLCSSLFIVSSLLKLRGISCFWNLDKDRGHQKFAQK